MALLPQTLQIVREKFKLPWNILKNVWRDEYQEKIYNVGKFFYKNKAVIANIVHLFPKEGSPEVSSETYKEKIQRTKFNPNVRLQEDTAILFLPGLGDIWQLMATAQHQEIFPTNEFYVSQFPDSQFGKTLKTTIGGIDEAFIALCCLRYLTNVKEEHGKDKYNRIIVFGNHEELQLLYL